MRNTLRIAVVLSLLLSFCPTISYAVITEKDVLVVTRLIGLLEGVKRNSTVRLAVIGDDIGSRMDAASFIELVEKKAKTIGGVTLEAVETYPAQLKNTQARILILPASLDDTNLERIFEMARKRKLVTISMSEGCVYKKYCAIAVKTEPAVDIKMSSSAAAATEVRFSSAFRMVVKEFP